MNKFQLQLKEKVRITCISYTLYVIDVTIIRSREEGQVMGAVRGELIVRRKLYEIYPGL